MSTECSLRACDAPESEIMSVSRGKLFHQALRGSQGACFTLHAVPGPEGSVIVEHSSKNFIAGVSDAVAVVKDRCDASPLVLRRDIFPSSAVAFELHPGKYLFFDKNNKKFSFRSFPDAALLPSACAFDMEISSQNFFLKRPRVPLCVSPPSKRARPVVSMALGPVLEEISTSRSPSPIPQRRSSEVQTELQNVVAPKAEVVHAMHFQVARPGRQEMSVQTDPTAELAEAVGRRRSSGLMESASVLKQVSDELFEASEENKFVKTQLAALQTEQQNLKERLQVAAGEKGNLEAALGDLQSAKTSLEGEYLALDRALAKERSERLEYTRKTENILEKLRQELGDERRKNEELARVKADLAAVEAERVRLLGEVGKLNGQAVSRDCEVFELDEAKQKLQIRIDQLARSLEETQSALKNFHELQREHAQVKDELENLVTENSDLQTKLHAAVTKEQSLAKELYRVSDQCETAKRELEAATRKTHTLDTERRQLFMKTQEMENLTASLARMREHSEELRRQGEQHKLSKEQLERENRKLQSQVEQLKRELADREEKLEAAVKNLKKQEFLQDFKSKVTRKFEENANTLNTTSESPAFLPVKAAEATTVSAGAATAAVASVARPQTTVDKPATVSRVAAAEAAAEGSSSAQMLGSDGLGQAWREAIARYPMDVKPLVVRKAADSNEFSFGTKEVVCKQMGLNVTVQYGGENLLLEKFIDKYGRAELQRRKSMLRASLANANGNTHSAGNNNGNNNRPAIKFKLKLANRKEYLSTNGN